MEQQVVEEVEGLDVGASLNEGMHYPLDDVMVRSEIRTVGEIIKRVENNRYVMDPEFQRDFVWDKVKQSKLIESCVMRIPLPVFYVAEGADGRVTVVDGLQRLSTFLAFLKNDLKITGLGKDHPLEGKTHKQLPVNIQERIEDTQLTLYILDKNAPEAARLDIFERVNSGVPLTRQQMRNALYSGVATRWLSDRASKNPFLEATGGTLQRRTMRDREAINRFCAFTLFGAEGYPSGDMDEFLALALRKMNTESEETLRDLRVTFVTSMKRNLDLFGKHSFRKSIVYNSPESPRSVINIALFDVMSVVIPKIGADAFENKSKEIASSVRFLLRDEEFANYISASTNSRYQVRGRFDMTEKALEPFL